MNNRPLRDPHIEIVDRPWSCDCERSHDNIRVQNDYRRGVIRLTCKHHEKLYREDRLPMLLDRLNTWKASRPSETPEQRSRRLLKRKVKRAIPAGPARAQALRELGLR